MPFTFSFVNPRPLTSLMRPFDLLLVYWDQMAFTLSTETLWPLGRLLEVHEPQLAYWDYQSTTVCLLGLLTFRLSFGNPCQTSYRDILGLQQVYKDTLGLS